MKIKIGKFSDTGWSGDAAEAGVYANGSRVGEIWRHMGRNADGAWFVFSYTAQIWVDDAGAWTVVKREGVRDSRGRKLQTPAQAKHALKRWAAEWLAA